MITLNQFAQTIEDELNQTLNNPEIKFKIWAEAGEYKPPHREGNTIVYEIIGNMRTSTSANDANDLVMGVNGLSLDFIIPVVPPRTNAKQTEAELAKIKEGQYPFIKYATNAINAYFQKAVATTMTDDEGVEFSVAYQAGTATSGTVALRPKVGNSIDMSVFIEVYFGEGALSSKNVKIYMDGELLPFQTTRQGRSPITERDVYAGSLVSKGLHTSTAFAIDLTVPASKNKTGKECLDYLTEGKPNVAHFINLVYDDQKEELYFMTLNEVQTSVAGISFMGINASFIEVAYNSEVYGVPSAFQVGRFILEDTETESLSFTLSENCEAFIAGNASKLSAGAITVPIEPSVIEYDEEGDNYYVSLVTDKAVNVSDTSTHFVVTKEAVNG